VSLIDRVIINKMGKPKAKKKSHRRSKQPSKARNGEESSSSKYTLEELLSKAEELIHVELNFELGAQFCQRALEMEPDDVKVRPQYSRISC